VSITGIAAIMLHSSNPAALAHWYSEHLGIPLEPEEGAWHGEILDSATRARTYFGVLPAEAHGAVRPSITVTFRTGSFDSLVATLQQSGILIDRLERSEFGRVAYLRDLDGNPIELWAESIPQRAPAQSDVSAEGL
jgi:catechol 2,3-dioxygenase-like lactoylglutathione lyase family enzyme